MPIVLELIAYLYKVPGFQPVLDCIVVVFGVLIFIHKWCGYHL